MMKYCLSYDAQDSNAWKAGELKIKIIDLLIKKGKAVNLRNPVGSTLLFEDNTDENRISFWNNLLTTEFKKGSSKTDINYYLALIAHTKTAYVDRIEYDKELEKSFKELLLKQ